MLKQELITRKKFNFLKRYYDKTWDPLEQTLHVGIFNKSTDSLAKSYKNATEYLINKAQKVKPITSESIILDVGCGTGKTLLSLCRQYGCRGVGVDLSDEQIKSARASLAVINKQRVAQGRPAIKCRFVRSSASNLQAIFPKENIFTHIISQDALFLVVNKKSCYENLYRLLKPGGSVGIADFLSYNSKKDFNSKQQKSIYKLVNWGQGLSFAGYQFILQSSSFEIVDSEERNNDIIKTYNLLNIRMKRFIKDKDHVYQELFERYADIVKAVKNHQMGWGLFIATKPRKKQAILTGTRKKSISRVIAKELHSRGYEVWLYSRHARKIDNKYWHERLCDASNENDVKRFLGEVGSVDLAIQLADTRGGHSNIESLSELAIKDKIAAKLTGSVILSKHLIRQAITKQHPIQLVWCAGKISKKPKNLILYSLVNSGLAAFIDEINNHYIEFVKAYYLPTTLISPSTLGDDYIAAAGPASRKMAEQPTAVSKKIIQIIENKFHPGIIGDTDKIL